MKIVGILPGRYSSDPITGAIVELSRAELCRILGKNGDAILRLVLPGAVVEINERFDHAQDVLAAANSAKKLPGVLRALADTLEITHPAIQDIIEPVIDSSFEVTP